MPKDNRRLQTPNSITIGPTANGELTAVADEPTSIPGRPTTTGEPIADSLHNKKSENNEVYQKYEALTMAFIGCGPSGMSFLHAVALRKLRMEEEGDVEELSKLAIVACFDRAPEPGGVWRSQRACLNDILSTSYVESSTDGSSSDGEDRDIDKIASDDEASILTKYFSVEENEMQINIDEICHQTDSGSVSSDSSEYSDPNHNPNPNQCSQALKKKGEAGQSTNHVGTSIYELL